MRLCLLRFCPLLLLLLQGCAHRLIISVPIIDAHIHTPTEVGGEGEPPPESVDSLLKDMERLGVVGAVAHTSAGDRGYRDLHAHGIIHCAGIKEEVSPEEVEAGLRTKKFACIKIYLGYVHRYASDERYEPFYKLAASYDVPVVFHTGDVDSARAKLKYSDPITIDEVAVDHPRVTFVIAHCGNPWIQTAVEVAYKNPNVYLDGSGLLLGDLSRFTEGELDTYMAKSLVWVLGYLEKPDKLLFGSDAPYVSLPQYLAVFQRAIPSKYWQAVFHDNAVRVFHLDRK